MVQYEATDSNKSMVNNAIDYMKKKGVKSPKYKYWYSPDGGRTKIGYNNKRDLPKLKKKYEKLCIYG